MKTLEIQSVAEYVSIVCGENCNMKKKGAHKTLLFRGQADKDNELHPSLARKDVNGHALLNEEHSMIEMAKYKLPSVFHRDLEPIELLALLQHHGIPTRLLDVTENALVGLYFSCHGNETSELKDGEVLVFETEDIDVTNYPMMNYICDTYRVRGMQSQEQLEKLYEFCKQPLFIYAPSYSLRQNIQGGRYILFSNVIKKTEEGFCMEDEILPISKEHEAVACRIIIPASVKAEIRRDLRLLGVSKELLFLDNADVVCREIRDRFSER